MAIQTDSLHRVTGKLADMLISRSHQVLEKETKSLYLVETTTKVDTMTAKLSINHQISRKKGQPLYMQVVDVIRSHLTEAVWKPGDELPSFDKLASELGVSRITIRDAISILSDEGLLVSTRGRGTIVTEKSRGHRRFRLETTFEELVSTLRTDHPDLTTLELSRGPLPSGFRGSPVGEYQSIKRIHVRDDLRYCVIKIHIATSLYDQEKDLFLSSLALPIFAEKFADHVHRMTQKMKFGKCDVTTSQLLGYPAGDPVAFAWRSLTNDKDEIIYAAEITYRADIVEIDLDLFSR